MGGRDGRTDLGGLRNMSTYVSPLAKDAPSKRFPHCLWTRLDVFVDWVWELIMIPSSNMTNAGIGFKENSYVSGALDCLASSSW